MPKQVCSGVLLAACCVSFSSDFLPAHEISDPGNVVIGASKRVSLLRITTQATRADQVQRRRLTVHKTLQDMQIETTNQHTNRGPRIGTQRSELRAAHTEQHIITMK